MDSLRTTEFRYVAAGLGLLIIAAIILIVIPDTKHVVDVVTTQHPSVGIVDIDGSDWTIITRLATGLWPGEPVFKRLLSNGESSAATWAVEFDAFVVEFRAANIRSVIVPTSSAIFNAWLDLLAVQGTSPSTKYPTMSFIARNLGTERLDSVSNAYRLYDIRSGKDVSANITNVFNSTNMPHFNASTSKLIYFHDGSAAIGTNIQFVHDIAESKGFFELVEIKGTWSDGTGFLLTDYVALQSAIELATAGSVVVISMSAANGLERFVSFTNRVVDSYPAILDTRNNNIDMYFGSNYHPLMNTDTDLAGLPSDLYYPGFHLGITASDGPVRLDVVNAMTFPLDEKQRDILNAAQFAGKAFLSAECYGYAVYGKNFEGLTGTLKFDEHRNAISYYISTWYLPAGESIQNVRQGTNTQNPRWIA